MTQPNNLPKTPEEVAEAHQQSDVDSSAIAQHHTLGFSPTQAAPGNHTHDGTGTPSLSGYAVTGHHHAEGDVTSLVSDLGGKAASVHSHSESQVTGLLSDLAGKAAASHSHAESDVTSLTSDLAGKAAASHSHAESDVTSLTSDLAGKAAASHSHAESDTTGLVSDLAGKAATSHSHTESDVTSLTSDLSTLTSAVATLNGLIHHGSGSPETVVTAPVGSLFLRSDGGAGTTLYVKETGSGNTGWAAK